MPSAIVPLDEFPLTRNGKLDVAALPDPVSVPVSDTQVPENATEQALVSIWQEVLGVPVISVHDNFFALGGHSLRASQVLTRIRAELGVTMSLRLIFDNPTVALLAVAVGQNTLLSRNPV